MGRKYLIDFNMNENEIRKNFLDWVILGDNTPIDIAYKANIEAVKRTFFPIRGVYSDYEADWSATSIWEHTEEYQVTVPMVKYREVLSYDQNHNPYSTKIHVVTEEKYANNPNMQRWPIIDRFNKTETREKTVIDKTERTSGTIEGKYCSKVLFTEDDNEEKSKWLDSIPLDEKKDFSDSAVSGAELKPLPKTDEMAHDSLIPDIKAKASLECKEEIPGTRYEDYSMDSIRDSYDVDLYYLPIYEVSYDYDGKKFDVLMSGSVKDSAFFDEKPVDADLKEKKEAMESEIEALKKERLKFGLLGFGLGPVLLLIALISGMDSFISLLMLLGGLGCAGYFGGYKFVPKNQEVKGKEQNLNVHLSGLDEKRKEIAAIVANDDLSADEQKARIQKLIES